MTSSAGAATTTTVPQVWVYPPGSQNPAPIGQTSDFGPLHNGDSMVLQWNPSTAKPAIGYACITTSGLVTAWNILDADKSTSPYTARINLIPSQNSTSDIPYCHFWFPNSQIGNSVQWAYALYARAVASTFAAVAQLSIATSTIAVSSTTSTIPSTTTITTALITSTNVSSSTTTSTASTTFPTTTTTSSSSLTQNTTNSGLSAGTSAGIGIVVAVIILILGACGILIWWLRRRRRSAELPACHNVSVQHELGAEQISEMYAKGNYNHRTVELKGHVPTYEMQ